MSNKSSIGSRMKQYEAVSKTYLLRRTPVIIRIDGKAFHTFTRGFKKPFDRLLMSAMQNTMLFLCKNIQGCVLGYTQSDEITLVLTDYENIDSSAWFDYQVQKLCSVSSSMATFAFNKCFRELVNSEIETGEMVSVYRNEYNNIIKAYKRAIDTGAMFDSRAFNIPINDVENCLIWRQQDATRNSIQMLAHSLYKHKELQGLSCNKLQDKMFMEMDINWNDCATDEKRGSCCIREDVTIGEIVRSKWIVDTDIPIFSQDPDREYIRSRIYFK